MGKKSGLGMIAFAAAAGATAAFLKYLKDYTDFKLAAEKDFRDLEGDTEEVKSAAKRTYVALKEKSNFKTAAGDLARATGEIAKDAGSIAVKAGQQTVQTVKEMKERYAEDPETLKAEVMDNLKEMRDDVSLKVSAAAAVVSDRLPSSEELRDNVNGLKEKVLDAAQTLKADYEKNKAAMEAEAEDAKTYAYAADVSEAAEDGFAPETENAGAEDAAEPESETDDETGEATGHAAEAEDAPEQADEPEEKHGAVITEEDTL